MNFTASFSAVGLMEFIMKKESVFLFVFLLVVSDHGVKTKESVNYI